MAIFSVSSSAELYAALADAKGGDTIKLAAGDYGSLDLDQGSGFNANSPVTIVSANANNPASFSAMDLNGVSNLTFDSVKFDYTFSSSDSQTNRPFTVENSENITIKNSHFDGDLASGKSAADNGFGYGIGLTVRDSSGVTVENNEFSDWYKGASFKDSSDLEVSENDIHSIRSDGLNFVEVSSVLIENNYIHDFKSSPTSSDHKDMIQFWTTRSSGPSEDVIIRGNTLDIGDGSWSQSIFMRNGRAEGGNVEEYYKNITIENNTIYNSHAHALVVGETDGLTIRSNTIVQVYGDPNFPMTPGSSANPRISVSEDSLNVVIEHNAAANFTGYEGQSSWSFQNNAVIQGDAGKPGYYGDVFTAESLAPTSGAHNFIAKDGSVLDQLNAGASVTLGETDPTTGGGNGGGSSSGGDASSGGGSTGGGSTGGGDATDEGDTSGGGSSDGGSSDDPDSSDGDGDTSGGNGGGDTSSGGGGTAGSGELPDYDDYILDIAALTNADLNGSAVVVDTPDGPMLSMEGKRKDSADLGRIDALEDSDQLSFAVEFTRDDTQGGNERLVWNHKKFGVTIVDDGLKIQVGSNDRAFRDGFTIEDLGLDDTDTHTLAVVLDADTDRLQVFVDDKLVLDESDTDFDITGGREYGWTLGSAWGNGFDGEISDFRAEADADFIDVPVGTEDALLLG